MRLMLSVELDTETSNPLVASGKIGEVIGQVMEQLKPEASYFCAHGGGRAIILVVEVPDSSYLVTVSEPFWQQLNASVTVTPCMNLEELQAGLGRLH